ncbi:P1 family peptidase [Luteimonas sp. Y-2-2-4F]|nr:P1 family peptidase [Luteimonas sp. Y-2-2-4F]MCD9033643.1 P1 family peptidase [Luteimonas sp. Y-2-2-4F]
MDRVPRSPAPGTVAARLFGAVLAIAAWTAQAQSADAGRPRAREAGIAIGVHRTGALNAITDVAGVRVGHATLAEGDRLHTGVTAILPHGGNVFADRVPAAIVVGNGFGKLIGASQVEELGELETPVLLTGTLGVWKAADALAAWMLERPGMEDVRSINPVVGETNDGFLNDIRQRALQPGHVRHALETAAAGPVAEGAVGAGAGTVAFGWKGGIGTSSRIVAAAGGDHTVGVLVQSNYGGRLAIAGVPVWTSLPEPSGLAAPNTGDGSIMIVVATDAPLDARQLRRLATRALAGLARTGSSMSHGSGDYVVAFSASERMRRRQDRPPRESAALPDDALTPLFEGVAEATEEAIVNSLFRAETVRGHRGAVPALPLQPVLDALRDAGVLRGAD